MSYLIFTKIEDTGKTGIYSVRNHGGDNLALIRWHGAWRKYCFYPIECTIFDVKCLTEINEFITKLMEGRKNERTNR